MALMRLVYRWGDRDGQANGAARAELLLPRLVLAAWMLSSAAALFVLAGAGPLRLALAASLCLWPIAVFWRSEIFRRGHRPAEAVRRIYALLLRSLLPCSVLWFLLLYRLP